MDTAFRTRNDRFAFLHFGRNVTFRIDSRLLTDIFRRDLVRMNFGNFDVIAKNLVVTDLQGIHAQAFPFAGFQRSDPFPTVLDFGIHLVEFRRSAFADHAAFTHRHRKVIVQHPENFVTLAFRRKERFRQRMEHRGF